MKRGFVFIFVILVLAQTCFATRIHGVIYDGSLNPVENSVVEVNSVPLQRLISKDGSYSFNLNPGNYVITAVYDSTVARENVSIKDSSGDYVIDLFLFPTFEEEEELLNDTNFDIGNIYPQENNSLFYVVVMVLIVLVFGAVFLVFFVKFKKKAEAEFKHTKHESKEEKQDLDTFVKFIKDEGGRVTQKDIRKKFPLSEAKISLMISELEHKGTVQKIKKGRGNIIVLKK